MSQRVNANRLGVLATTVLFLGVTWFSIWGVEYIPIESLHIPSYWKSVLYHGVCALIWVALIWFFTPHVFSRFTVRVPRRRLLIALFVIFFFVSPNFRAAGWHGNSLLFIASALLFAICIGLNEDLLSRGFFFGVLEKYGVWAAAIISSLQFGALHLTNFYYGGQSFDYTAGQMVNAAAFGFLCCALMLFTGSIWAPVLFHGLSDFPLMMQSQVAFRAQVTGGADWLGTLVEGGLMVIVGVILMTATGLWRAGVTKRALRALDLIE